MASLDVFVNDVLAAGQAIWRREPKASAGELSGTPEIMIDEQAFHVFYRRTAPGLRAYAARVLGNATYADDIVQESYLRLVRSPPATDDPQQLRAFLFRVASRLIVDHWRRGRHESGQPDQSADTRGAPGPDIPLRLDMARVFEQLNPQQRQLMWLAYVEGSDHREIAAALGLRERSVRVLLHRTRRKLAQLLREGGRAPERSG
jgi:RNA polymerase sigma-70 factor (ECF subfamily)